MKTVKLWHKISISKNLLCIAFPLLLSMQLENKKKSNITNVLLLFMTETGEGKCEIIIVELKM